GLGTPNGFSAFAQGPHGTVSGTVTDATSGDPVAGATVTIGGQGSVQTAADGTYSTTAAPGTYAVTFAAYGYKTVTKKNVVVTDGGTVTASAALTKVAFHSVTGRVSDGSGHGYALYSRIDVDGMPGGPVYTDPYDGTYSIDLPQGGTFNLTYTSIIPGYQPLTKTAVKVGGADRVVNASLKVDTSLSSIPGYTISKTGTTQTFDAATAPAGWTVTDKADPGWVFNDPGSRGNLTGGDGGFAIVDSDHSGTGVTQDSYLTSPKTDLSKATGPTLEFDTYFKPFSTSDGVVEASTDGGTSWAAVWDANGTAQSGHVVVALGAAAKTANVQVRFHYTGSYAYYWEVDNVFVGDSKPVPTHGGLLEGVVKDANTAGYVKGAKVASDTDATITGTTGPTGDPAVGDGFYWLFSTLTGAQPFSATKGGYGTGTATPNVKANLTTHQDYTLQAGQLSVTPASIDKTVKMGKTATQKLTLKNTGGLPATVTIGEGAGGFVMASKGGAPAQTVKTTVFNGSAKAQAAKAAKSHAKQLATEKAASPSADAWAPIADYPSTIQDSSAAAIDGTAYSVGGYDGTADTSKLYAYDAQAGSWSALAPATEAREAGQAAAVGGKLIWTGGWGPTGAPDGTTEIYDPAGDSWSTGAANPKPHSAAGKAVIDSKAYFVGGCDTSTCGSTDVQVYDAAADSWSSAAPYPQTVAWEACGGIGGKIYCAGGDTDAATSTKTYVYDPAADSWSPAADLPADLWGSYSAAANGLLLVSGGVVDNSAAITNTGYSYDPASDSWTALPNLNTALYRGSGAVGFYAIGGNPGGAFAPPVATDQLLAGYDQGGNTDVPWLSEDPTDLTLAPGASATVTVTLNAADPSIAQPGVYTAAVTATTDTPYSVPSIAVNMTLTPPASWGKIAGSVTTVDKTGAAVPGATVELDGWAQTYTLTTDKDGKYGIWMDKRNNPITAIVADNGFKPQTAKLKVIAGQTVTKNWVLVKK
ncbi:MAG: carboxypeptidase regulatory-like domain-containing protein, partial [Nakamurella sp.]